MRTKFLSASLLCLGMLLAVTLNSSRAVSRQHLGPEAGMDSVLFHPNTDLNIGVPRLDGTIHIDGVLEEAEWTRAAKVGNFSEVEPGDNVKPAVETEVRLAYDAHALYVAFHCHDDPTAIRATFSDRDNFQADDIVFFVLDTFHNHQTAYQLGVNPYGLQVDILRNMDDEDVTYDLVWQSAGRMVEDGWVAEIAVPFKSLRFPDTDEQKWGFHCVRIRPRESYEQMSWAPLDRDNPCFLCQAGTLTGITDVKTGHNVELLPYGLSFQSGSLTRSEDPASFHDEDLDGDVGLNVKYGLSSDLTVDCSINPDFSQVESDAAQIDVNTTFALFYPEKRPFFLEGSDIFLSQIRAIYTRSINDPILAAKLTGRAGKTSIGYMVARDEHTPFILPLQEQSVYIGSHLSSVSNILRIKHSLREDSFIGLLATDRELDQGHNRLAGLDANIRFLPEYRLSVQALQAWTEEPQDTTFYSGDDSLMFDDGHRSAAFDGERFHGLGLAVTVQRTARHLNFRLSYESASPAFRADNGFLERTDFRTASAWAGLLFRPDGRLFDEIEPQVYGSWRYDHDGRFKEKWINAQLETTLKSQTEVSLGGLVVNDEQFRGKWLKSVLRGHISVSTAFSEFVSGGLRMEMGDFIDRYSDVPSVGYGYDASGELVLKFTSQFVVENSIERYRLTEERGGPEIFDEYVLRTKAMYQATRNLFTQLIGQYDSSENCWEIDPLVSYKINPFSAFYAGATHDFVDFDEPHGWSKTSRQFFMKFQYLFRL